MKHEAPYLTTNDSRLVDIFTGRRIQITSDSETNDLTKKSDTFNVIQLHSIPTEGVSIQDAIFDTCRHYHPSQNIIITEIPDIIVVDTNQPCNKLLFASLFQIRVDGILAPNPFHDADQSDKPQNSSDDSQYYTLYAFCLYRGSGSSGHYIAFTYSSVYEKWIVYDAEDVTIAPNSQFLCEYLQKGWIPKLLFYHKQTVTWKCSIESRIITTKIHSNNTIIQGNPLDTPVPQRTPPPSSHSTSNNNDDLRSPFNCRIRLGAGLQIRQSQIRTKSRFAGTDDRENTAATIETNYPKTRNIKRKPSVMKCPVFHCNYIAPSERAIDLHIRNAHPKEKPIRCPSPSCTFCTSSYKYLNDHRKRRQYQSGLHILLQFSFRYTTPLLLYRRHPNA